MIDRREFIAGSSLALSAAALGGVASVTSQAEEQPQPRKKYRLIATEEAFASPEQVEYFRKAETSAWTDPDIELWRHFLNTGILLRRLLDVEQERLSIMDQAGVDMHLLSLTSPGVQCLNADAGTALAASANDYLAEIIKRHPDRYAGLGSFAPQDPARAAKEIDRAITKLELNGMIVNSSTNKEYFDNKKFYPIFEALTALDTPLYIHPRNMPEPWNDMLKADVNLWAAIWGFQAETSLHAMRMIISGVFDDFPNLKVVLGHMGEGVPYWLYRIDWMYLHNPADVYKSKSGRRLKRKPSEYVKDNITITTSGMNTHDVLNYNHTVLGADHIMFAIDYPYQESVEAATFMQTATLPEADMEKITHGNAERLFRIRKA